MTMNNPYDVYKNNTVFTATPEELTLMLYDGALKFLTQAEIAIEKKNYEKSGELIMRVEDIIRELQITLDFKYEISNSLNNLYTFIHERLIDANISKDLGIIAEVKDLLRDLRDTWREAIRIARHSQTQPQNHATAVTNNAVSHSNSTGANSGVSVAGSVSHGAVPGQNKGSIQNPSPIPSSNVGTGHNAVEASQLQTQVPSSVAGRPVTSTTYGRPITPVQGKPLPTTGGTGVAGQKGNPVAAPVQGKPLPVGYNAAVSGYKAVKDATASSKSGYYN